jgi:aldehyde:ferredoxin oxidoreductase
MEELMGGMTGRVLFVDLTARQYRVGKAAPADYLDFLGARGMAARYYERLISPAVHPFDAGNKLIFFTGPLTGTRAPAGTKFNLATKSPETGRYMCSNSSGNFGPYLKQNGYDSLILEGESETPVRLLITPAGVEFGDATDLWGLTVEQTVERAEKIFGQQVSTMSVGPAGENGVRFSSIQVDGRSFGRGGGGAVMGYKKVKLVAVNRGEEVAVYDSEGIKKVVAELGRTAREQKKGLVDYGTAQLTEVLNSFGAYPTRNFASAEFEGASAIDAHTMKRDYWVKNTACFRCPVACGKLCTVKEGKYAGATSDPEYETIWAFGAHCGISDFAVIVKANQICDDYGMDTMTSGYLAGVAMELSEKGLITPEETGGYRLAFGDSESLLLMLELIARGRGLGALFAKGVLGIIEERPEWEPFLVHVKGMPFAAYDPRGLKGMGLAFGTSSRGACHNVGGWTISDELGSGKYDRFALEGKGGLIKTLQDTRAYIDSLGVCTQVRKALGFTDKPEEVILKMVTGLELAGRLMEIGERVFNLERLILVSEGVTSAEDRMPARMSEALPSGQACGHSLGEEDFRVMLQEYYRERGWDENGVPGAELRSRLGLDDIRT